MKNIHSNFDQINIQRISFVNAISSIFLERLLGDAYVLHLAPVNRVA
jgi:hypothetical protein